MCTEQQVHVGSNGQRTVRFQEALKHSAKTSDNCIASFSSQELQYLQQLGLYMQEIGIKGAIANGKRNIFVETKIQYGSSNSNNDIHTVKLY